MRDVEHLLCFNFARITEVLDQEGAHLPAVTHLLDHDTGDCAAIPIRGSRFEEMPLLLDAGEFRVALYQGDTEFASVEQQRHLFETAPTDWDRRAITRVMIEEMRHGWQMCALLIEHFGYSGKVEAQKMLNVAHSRTSACWERSMLT